MRILTLAQGTYGHRITAHIRQQDVPGWELHSWTLPQVLPPVIDYPEDYLPSALPAADLLLALGEHPGVAELLPDVVQMCGAQAVIVPVDNVAWMPPGLMRQLAGWLAELDVSVIFPKPFCSLTETTYNAYRQQTTYDIPLVAEFARHFGKPVFEVAVAGADRYDGGGETRITGIQVRRDTPCGCAQHVACGLAGLAVDDAEHAAGMLHHHYPCLAAMVIDPEYSDTLMHVSGRILKEEVARHLRPYTRPPVYLRPAGRSE